MEWHAWAAELVDVVSWHSADRYTFRREFIAWLHYFYLARELSRCRGNGHDDRVFLLDLSYILRGAVIMMIVGDQDEITLGAVL
jgi:hypothetical protein